LSQQVELAGVHVDPRKPPIADSVVRRTAMLQVQLEALERKFAEAEGRMRSATKKRWF